jgi:hypothetical protein
MKNYPKKDHCTSGENAIFPLVQWSLTEVSKCTATMNWRDFATLDEGDITQVKNFIFLICASVSKINSKIFKNIHYEEYEIFETLCSTVTMYNYIN